MVDGDYFPVYIFLQNLALSFAVLYTVPDLLRSRDFIVTGVTTIGFYVMDPFSISFGLVKCFPCLYKLVLVFGGTMYVCLFGGVSFLVEASFPFDKSSALVIVKPGFVTCLLGNCFAWDVSIHRFANDFRDLYTDFFRILAVGTKDRWPVD